MSLGESLKSARNAVGLTQDQVAKKMYVTRQTVSRWEQGKTLPNIYVLRELKQLYGLSLDNLSLQTKRNEEFRKMKKINWLALFGAIIFNLCLFSSVLITAAGLLLSIWTISISFIFSPIILLIVNLLGLQSFSLIQTSLSIVFFIIGIFLYPFAKKVGYYLIDFLIKYLRFNQRAIYK